MKQNKSSNIDTTRCNLYLPSGFPDMVDIIDKANAFCAIVAARAVGKTVSGVGALDTIAKRDSLEFPFCFFMRRTGAIMDELMNPLLNPLFCWLKEYAFLIFEICMNARCSTIAAMSLSAS